eukprot:TRINITY_DN4158_c1_g1_i1.p1 TRINITY_DN4158_c1_g1~~TRINITY_DN4158_c1_g1_i1.p1  ORF type:complete len:887 (+),score=116.70 TRINITY_DN4158_c1_g1_i1:117-2777(+)
MPLVDNLIEMVELFSFSFFFFHTFIVSTVSSRLHAPQDMRSPPKVCFANAKPRFAAFHPNLPICAIIMKHESLVNVFNYDSEVVTKGVRIFNLNALCEEIKDRSMQTPTSESGDKAKKITCGEVKGLEFFDCSTEYFGNKRYPSGTYGGFLRSSREYFESQKHGSADEDPPGSTVYIKVTLDNKILLVPYSMPDTAMGMLEVAVPQPPDRSKVSFVLSKGLSVARSTVAVALSDGTIRLWKVTATNNNLSSVTPVGSSTITCLTDILISGHHKQRRCLLAGDTDCTIHGFTLHANGSNEMTRFLRIKRSNFTQKPTGSIVAINTQTWKGHLDEHHSHITIATTGSLHILKQLKITNEQGSYVISGEAKNKSTIVGVASVIQEGHGKQTTLRVYESGLVKIEHPHTTDPEHIELGDKKHSIRVYSVVQHCSNPYLVGIATNMGLHIINLRDDIVCDAAVAVPVSDGELPDYVSIHHPQCVLHVRQGHRSGHSVEHALPDGDKFHKVFPSPIHRHFTAITTHNKLYIYEIQASPSMFFIVEKTHISHVQAFAWHWKAPRIAIIRSDFPESCTLYDFVDVSPTATFQEITKKDVAQSGEVGLIGGKWLAVKNNKSMSFVSWDDLSVQSPEIPAAESIVWDPYTGNCAFVYPQSIAVMTSSEGVFKQMVEIPVDCDVVVKCLWVHGTLIVDTSIHIAAYFPRPGAYEASIIAVSYGTRGADPHDLFMTYDTARTGTAALEHIRVSGSMQARPAGTLDMLGFIGDTLQVRDCNGHRHYLKLSPSIKWRYCAQAKRLSAAEDWIGIAGITAYEIATFFAARGHTQEALSVPGLTPTCKAEISTLAKDYLAAVKHLSAVNTPFENLAEVAATSDGTSSSTECYLLVAEAGART